MLSPCAFRPPHPFAALHPVNHRDRLFEIDRHASALQQRIDLDHAAGPQ
jgi:hypothetical protein